MINPERFISEFYVSLVDRPSDGPDHVFLAPGAGARANDVLVQPWAGPAWTASFAAPDPGIRALTAFLGTASPTGLCVVERGTAFAGDVRAPERFEVIDSKGAVVASEEFVDEGCLLLLTPCSLTVIDRYGSRWTTKRIAMDGLRIDEVRDGWVRGVSDPGDDGQRAFAVNLTTRETCDGVEL